MSPEHLAKMKEARERKQLEDKEAREKLVRETDAEVRLANKEADDDKIKGLVDKAMKIHDLDTKITGGLDIILKAQTEKVRLSSKGTATISPKEALRIVQKSL